MATLRVRVEINEAALDRESGEIFRGFHRSLTRRIANQARADVPVDTGALGRSIAEMPQVSTPFRVDGGVEAGGGAENVRYAAPVHEGRRARVIRARNAQYLHFWWKGREIFTREVHQGPMKGRPFLRNAGRRIAATDPRIEMSGVS